MSYNGRLYQVVLEALTSTVNFFLLMLLRQGCVMFYGSVCFV